MSDVLVYASSVAIRSLVERLQCQFDVKIMSNLFVEVISDMPILRLASAVIMPAEDYEAARAEKLEQAEFDRFTQSFGLSVDQFLSIRQSLGSLTSTESPFSPRAYPGQLKKAFRAAGHKITERKVLRALYLIEKFSADR